VRGRLGSVAYPIPEGAPLPEETLPERLRELADAITSGPQPNGDQDREDAAALTGAADELERLAVELAAAERGRDFYSERLGAEREAPATGRPLVDALEVLAALELHGAQHAPAGTDRGARGGTHAGGLRAADAIVRSIAGLDGDTPLHELGAELAVDAGVASPMPRTRAFVAYYREAEALPSPGSFAFVGPALAVWRVHRAAWVPAPDPESGEVLTVHRDEYGTERRPVFLELEAVDAHDVPATVRVEQVPLPVHEVDTAGEAIA
jgi:hypothetical protein